MLREQSLVPHVFPDAGFVGILVLFVERNTSITTSHKQRADHPSIRSPASNELMSDSVELWDTDVCFLRIQLMCEMFGSKNIRSILRLILSPQGRQQDQSLGIIAADNAEPCYPHDNNAGSHLCDEGMKLILPIVCRMLVSTQ